jgi:hypothetical protein
MLRRLSDVIEKIRDGEISKKGIRKTVADLVKEEKKALKSKTKSQKN